jgi:glutathione S-transferase
MGCTRAPWEAARHDAAMNAVEDLRAQLGPINRIKDPEEKKRAREGLAKGYLLDWAGYIEKQIAGPFFGGEKLQVADIKIFVTLTPLMKGAIDHIPAALFKPFAKLTALFEAVKAHPKVVAWYAR